MVQEHDAAYDDGTIEAVNLDTKERKVLLAERVLRGRDRRLRGHHRRRKAGAFVLPVGRASPNAWWHDVSRDGNQFVVLKAEESPAGAAGQTHLRLITNVLRRQPKP